uniref:Midkine n=1 Tax=Mastacembelus armatus TaxID=205130 RepID=A0A7N9AMK7_9TELE
NKHTNTIKVLLLILLRLEQSVCYQTRAAAGEFYCDFIPAGGKHDKSRPASECSPTETQYGKCVPEHGDCGDGLREVTCKDRTNKIQCKIPCNWKKDISDCKYKFGPWGSCDAATNTKSRSGTLKKALFNAECQATVRVSKPCSPRAKNGRGETGGLC